jgi:hypothetical protein
MDRVAHPDRAGALISRLSISMLDEHVVLALENG